jgi:putative ABC transport system substrate-binding protein
MTPKRRVTWQATSDDESFTLGSAAAVWPLAARGQQPSKLPMIGVIVGGTPSTHGQLIAGFVQRLRELGWIEDRTVAIEIRWAE